MMPPTNRPKRKRTGKRPPNARELRSWLISIISRWNSIEDAERRGIVVSCGKFEGVAQAMADDARCALHLTHAQAKAIGTFR